jgi:hypothetical protein
VYIRFYGAKIPIVSKIASRFFDLNGGKNDGFNP